jgi:hypothetical protein
MPDAIAKPLQEAISKIPELKSRFESVSKDLGLPLIGSPESNDHLAGWGGDMVGSYGSIKLSLAVDHLFAWHLLASPPVGWLPTYAHLTLLRPALEGAVQTRWVLDSTERSGTRIARALALRLDDLKWVQVTEDDIKAERITDPAVRAAATKPGAAERAQTVLAEAAAAGIARVRKDKTDALLKKYHLRSDAMDVVIWRFTSGVIHGQAWVLDLSDREVLRAGATMTSYKESANEPVAVLMTNIAIAHVERAIEDLRQYREPRKVG